MRTFSLAVLTCCLAYSQAPDKTLTFDAASVKPAAPMDGGRGKMVRTLLGRGGPGTTDPGRVHFPMATIKSLLTIAYDVKDYQISGPSWLDSERFEIQATMPPETTKEQLAIMLQNLLAERFKVAIHRETKELPMYSMVVAKNGPKMKESPPLPPEQPNDPARDKDAPPPAPPMPQLDRQLKMGADGFPILPMNIGGGRGGFGQIMMNGRAKLMATQRTMPELAERLSNMLSRPVTDLTNLKAKFDFTLTYLPEAMNGGMLPPPPPPPPGAGGRSGDAPDVETPPDLFTAMQSQLGLKLEPKKGPVVLIVVDHAEKTPTEN